MTALLDLIRSVAGEMLADWPTLTLHEFRAAHEMLDLDHPDREVAALAVEHSRHPRVNLALHLDLVTAAEAAGVPIPDPVCPMF